MTNWCTVEKAFFAWSLEIRESASSVKFRVPNQSRSSLSQGMGLDITLVHQESGSPLHLQHVFQFF